MNKPVITKEGITPITTHRFLDEAGDSTFFKKGHILAIGEQGISKAFSIGMVKIKSNLVEVRSEIKNLQDTVIQDKYLNCIPSVRKKISQGGFYFHATDDPAEVRTLLFHFIEKLNCSFEMVVARKIPNLFAKNHHNQESEFFADLLSHLIKGKLKLDQRLVLNIAERGTSTRNANLEQALNIARTRALKKWRPEDICSTCTFNVQTPRAEPILSIADYLCWSIQLVFEKGETRYYDFIKDKVSLIIDLYDLDNYEGGKNFYTRKRPITAKNKISPPLP